MISMTYDPRCETIRFVWRKVRFVFAAFRPNRGRKRNGLRGGRASVDCHGLGVAGRRKARLSTGRARHVPRNASLATTQTPDRIHRFFGSGFEALNWRPIAWDIPKAAPRNDVFVDEAEGAKSGAKAQLSH